MREEGNKINIFVFYGMNPAQATDSNNVHRT